MSTRKTPRQRFLGSVPDEPGRDTTFKDHSCFEHIREQSGQACSRLVSMIAGRQSPFEPEGAKSRHPKSSGYVSSSRCLGTRRAPGRGSCDLTTLNNQRNLSGRAVSRKTARLRRAKVPRERSGDQPSGGARRDRTDDLMLAKHALSQLSYGPISCWLKTCAGLRGPPFSRKPCGA